MCDGPAKIFVSACCQNWHDKFFFQQSNTNFWAWYFDAYIILKKNNEIEIFFFAKTQKKNYDLDLAKSFWQLTFWGFFFLAEFGH